MGTIKGAPIYGTYGGHYEDDGAGNTTWVPDGPGTWNQDGDGENYWAGDKYITGYEPDVFVPDTTSTPTTSTPTTSTPTTSTPTPKGDPIYGTAPRPQATDQGDDTMGYDSSYSTGYFGEQDEYGDRDWIGNPTNEIIGYNPTAPDTTGTVTDTTGTVTDTTGTTTDTTGTTTDPVVYTPPPIELGLDIPTTPYTAPVGGPPGDLGLGIPVAPTYYEEYVPPQQPMVPQQTQAELLQQIVDQGQAAQGFQDGGLATPVQEPMPMVGAGIASLHNRIQKQQVRSPLSSGIGGQGAVLGSFR